MPARKQPTKHPDFAKRLRESMAANGIAATTAAKELHVNAETVRLWRTGERMPGHDNMKRLAKLIGVSVAMLRDGEPAPADMIPGAMIVTNDEERALLEIYRSLKPWAQEALRKRAVQLHEDFGVKGPENPFGKKKAGTQ